MHVGRNGSKVPGESKTGFFFTRCGRYPPLCSDWHHQTQVLRERRGAKEVWGFHPFRSQITSVSILGLQFKGLREHEEVVPATEGLAFAGVTNAQNKKKTDPNISRISLPWKFLH